MGRFGRAAAWRNTATFGTLDEVRHGQIQAFFPYGLLPKEPRGDWALKAFHTDNWIVLAVRHLFDDMLDHRAGRGSPYDHVEAFFDE